MRVFVIFLAGLRVVDVLLVYAIGVFRTIIYGFIPNEPRTSVTIPSVLDRFANVSCRIDWDPFIYVQQKASANAASPIECTIIQARVT